MIVGLVVVPRTIPLSCGCMCYIENSIIRYVHTCAIIFLLILHRSLVLVIMCVKFLTIVPNIEGDSWETSSSFTVFCFIGIL